MVRVTVADVLTLPVVRAASPTTVAGAAGLDRVIRWVHTTELVDVGPLLRGGDLVLTTGIALPDEPEHLTAFAHGLDDSGAAGLVLELGRRWRHAPPALAAACEAVGLPLVTLDHEVRFAAVAQVVGERVAHDQLDELREADRVHDVFTELNIAEAGVDEVLAAAQQLSGCAVVWEDGRHGVLDYRMGGLDPQAHLLDWTARSRRTSTDGRTGWDSAAGWLITRVGRPDRGWGRLVVLTDQPPTRQLVAVAERAAAALAVHRLHNRRRDGADRRRHHELLVALLRDATSTDVRRRCALADVPVEDRRLVGIAVRVGQGPATAGRPAEALDAVLAATVHAVAEKHVAALVCEMDGVVRALLSFPANTADVDGEVDDLAVRIGRRREVTIAAGRPVARAGAVGQTLHESRHVLDAVRPADPRRPVHRLDDVHLRGLLSMLADDDRLHSFAERELGSIRAHDAAGRVPLLPVLHALLRHPGSRSDAAADVGIARASFYDRLAKLARVLDRDLDDPDVLVSLHVAVLVSEVVGDPGAGGDCRP